MKSDGHLGRSHLKGREGDAANVILTAVGHNLRRPRLAQGSAAANPARSLAIPGHAGSQLGFLNDRLDTPTDLRIVGA
jgi:IS5 family transposase